MSEEKCVSIQVPSNPLTSVTSLYIHPLFWKYYFIVSYISSTSYLKSSPQQVQVTISAEEVGATEKSPYSSFSLDDISSSSLLQIIR